jgi:hypothetical protein
MTTPASATTALNKETIPFMAFSFEFDQICLAELPEN